MRTWDNAYNMVINKLDDSASNLLENIFIGSKNTYNEAVQPNMQKMISYWDKELRRYGFICLAEILQ